MLQWISIYHQATKPQIVFSADKVKLKAEKKKCLGRDTEQDTSLRIVLSTMNAESL